MQNIVIIEAERTGYNTNQCETISVKELIKELQKYDCNALVYLSHDNGYMLGGIRPDTIK